MADWAPDASTGQALELAVRAQTSSPARTQAFATTLHGFFATGSTLELIREGVTVTVPLPPLQINGTTLNFPATTVTVNASVAMDIDSGDWDARIINGARFAITYDVGKTVGVVRVASDIAAGTSSWTIGPIVWTTETIPALPGSTGGGGGSCTLQINGAPATVAANGTVAYSVTSTGTTSAGSYPANSAATVVADMQTTNAASGVTLAGVSPSIGWAVGPSVKMGNDPRGTNTPSYWNPSNTALKSSAYWTHMFPWFVVTDLTGHTATNTRVQFRNARAYIKSKSSGLWTLGWSDNYGGASYEKTFAGLTNTPNVRSEATGGMSVAPPLGNFLHHGWFGNVGAINGPDVDCVFVTMQFRLILDNPAGTDDRASAAFGVHIGADYYPYAGFIPEQHALPAGYNPGVGFSRTKRATNDWQHINFATLSDGLDQDPGGGITASAFTSSPPPLDAGGGTVGATCTQFQTWLVNAGGGGSAGTGFVIAPNVVSPGNYSLALNNAVPAGQYLLWAKCNDSGGCQDSYVTVPLTITASGGGGGGGTGSGTPPNITWTAGAPTSCTSTKWGEVTQGTGTAVNDQWQVSAWGLDGTIVQTVCIGPSANQSNSMRFYSKVPLNWPSPGGTISEVKSYPVVFWGQPPGFPSSGQTNIPIRVGNINHLWAGHKGVTVAVDNSFFGHLSHDMRLMDTDQVFAGPGRPPQYSSNYEWAAPFIWMELFVVDRTWRGYGAHPNGRAASRYRGQYRIGGIDWHVYIQPGASNTPQLIWLPVSLPCPVPFDMAPLFQWAIGITYNQLANGPGTIFARGQNANSTLINPDKIFVSNGMGVEVVEGEIDVTISTAYLRCNID